VRQLVGNITDIVLPENFDCTEPTDLIVATDGLVLFGMEYHSWLISMKDEHTLLHGGGPHDGAPLYMTSYRSELGGICAGLAVIWVLARSGWINIITLRLVCDIEAAVKRCNQKLSISIYHSTESDWDLLKTFHSLQDDWCKEISRKVQWMKGHADREDKALTRGERLYIEADLLTDKRGEERRREEKRREEKRGEEKRREEKRREEKRREEKRREEKRREEKRREEPRGPYAARPLCMQGTKVTSDMRQQLASQLYYGKLKDYNIEKEKWTQYTFDSVAWREYKIAYKRLSKNRQVNSGKACYNLWQKGRKNHVACAMH
jgi:hypothetical protein